MFTEMGSQPGVMAGLTFFFVCQWRSQEGEKERADHQLQQVWLLGICNVKKHPHFCLNAADSQLLTPPSLCCMVTVLLNVCLCILGKISPLPDSYSWHMDWCGVDWVARLWSWKDLSFMGHGFVIHKMKELGLPSWSSPLTCSVISITMLLR